MIRDLEATRDYTPQRGFGTRPIKVDVVIASVPMHQLDTRPEWRP